MKKVIALILALTLCLSLCACHNSSDVSKASEKINLTKDNYRNYFKISTSVCDLEKSDLFGITFGNAVLKISCDQIASGNLNNVEITISVKSNESTVHFSDTPDEEDDHAIDVTLTIPISGHAETSVKILMSPMIYSDYQDESLFTATVTAISGTISD